MIPYLRSYVALFFLTILSVQAQPIVDLGIAAEGRLVPGDGLISVAAPSQGGAAIVAELKVRAGDTVKKGDVLAVLEGAEAAAKAMNIGQVQLDQAEDDINLAKEAVKVAEANLAAIQAQKAIAGQHVTEAETAVTVASKALARALVEHDAASNELNGQIAEYQRVIDELDPPRKDREELTIKQNMLKLQIAKLEAMRGALEEEMQTRVDSAYASVASAQARAAAAEAEVLTAQAELERVKKTLSQAYGEKRVASARLSQAQTEAKAFTVTAPSDGMVIRVNTQPGESVGPEGICYLGDTEHMFVEAQVYIDDIKRVKVGQKATVKSEIFENELTGTVAEIGLMVSTANLYLPDPTVFTDRRVVPVRIALDDDARAAKLIYAQVTVKISQGE